jgi:hypothetical protein
VIIPRAAGINVGLLVTYMRYRQGVALTD